MLWSRIVDWSLSGSPRQSVIRTVWTKLLSLATVNTVSCSTFPKTMTWKERTSIVDHSPCHSRRRDWQWNSIGIVGGSDSVDWRHGPAGANTSSIPPQGHNTNGRDRWVINCFDGHGLWFALAFKGKQQVLSVESLPSSWLGRPWMTSAMDGTAAFLFPPLV